MKDNNKKTTQCAKIYNCYINLYSDNDVRL